MTKGNRTLRDGLVLGLVAYAAVAAFYAVFDVLAARGMLYTVDLLGKAAFRGLRDPSVLQLPMRLDLTAIFLYNGLHLVVSLAIGCVVAWLIRQAEDRPGSALLFLGVIVGGYVATILVVGALTRPFRALLPWWSIVAANSAAVLLAGGWVAWKWPRALRSLLAFRVR
ncbi:MAG: hypothetical protein FIA95_02185 [Gemmatimonadetes bacterium]|nr:hypothetical protein [Gemmatimonadota bacterium]